ncbi:MAG: phosphomannomutase/phosphoglucomutase, partial [Candidatus Uhrbacteria bacterium]
MQISEEVFKSYDIRSTLDQLSDELAFLVGAGLVHLTEAKIIVVGQDMRDSSPRLATAAIQGIISQGSKVVDIGMCTTTMFNFAVSNYAEHQAGLMITASHNPAEYNGFKMADATGLPLSGQAMKEVVIGKEYPAVDLLGSVEQRDVSQDYINRLFELLQMPSLQGMKVVVDAGNGMGGLLLPKIFERLDCQMIPMYFEPDGTFPNHEANPAKEETLVDLQNKIKEVGADIGAAFDGDGDRVGFVDQQGKNIRGDILLGLLATEYLASHPGGKVTNSPNMSWIPRDAVLAAGGEVVNSPVGRTHVIKKMRETGAVLGGEVSCHFFFKEFQALESSEFAMLLILKMMAEQKKPLSEIIAPYLKYFGSGEINFKVEDKQGLINQF